MDTPASVLDEFDGPCVLHTFGAFSIDLQDFIADLEWKTREEGNKRWEVEKKDRRQVTEKERSCKREGKRRDGEEAGKKRRQQSRTDDSGEE